MRCRVYRNLDRPFTLLGVKGRYIPVALIGLLAIILIAVVLGSASAAALIVGGYVILLEVQQRFGEKGLSRFVSGQRLPKFILVRSKVWKR